ncbi:MAG: hypothetical protein AAFR82_07115, partial [Pseudomonadota bacterium]
VAKLVSTVASDATIDTVAQPLKLVANTREKSTLRIGRSPARYQPSPVISHTDEKIAVHTLYSGVNSR